MDSSVISASVRVLVESFVGLFSERVTIFGLANGVNWGIVEWGVGHYVPVDVGHGLARAGPVLAGLLHREAVGSLDEFAYNL